MIKKVIALVFVSFFVMSGLMVLTENNQNYNISINNVNSFTSSSFSPYDFSINKSIGYTSNISNSGQTFGCYDNSLYYISGDSITQFNFKNDKISTFLSFTSQPYQIEIYNNYMIVGYGNGIGTIASTLVNIYNFSNSQLYTFNLSYDYTFIQFSMDNNKMIIGIIVRGGYDANNELYLYSIILSPISITLEKSISLNVNTNVVGTSGYNNNIIFTVVTSTPSISQFGYSNIITQTLNTSISTSGKSVSNIIDLGNVGLCTGNSYYITDLNQGGTTSYSNNNYASNGLYFADSNYKNQFIPINLTNNEWIKLPVLSNNSNYQEFCYNGKIVPVYLPIGSGNTIFNSLTYIINGNNNLIIVNKNNVYVYSLYTYNLNVKSYNLFNNQLQDYFSLNGIIYTGYSNSFSFTQLPQTLIPLNTSTYYYNGSAITIIKSDFTGSGSNLYYNLSIYYQEIKPASIPLYDIFTYMYPISIIGLFVGMGAFIFTIKKRGYKI